MRRALVWTAIAACAAPQDPLPAPVVPPARPEVHAELAFVHVNVVAMDTPEVAKDRTVLVDHGQVIAIGDMPAPAGAKVIDGSGKYLMPGLADMHVHLDGTRGMLELFVQAGVTTVRNMAGSPRVLALRERVHKGELLGPTIITAGPFVDGPHPRWEMSDVVARPEDAERVVAAQAVAGYDFIKVYNGLSLASYDAVAEAARRHHLRIAGHVPFAVPLEHALFSEQASIEHLTGFLDAVERPDHRVHHTGEGMLRGWVYADHDRIADIAAQTARHGVWSCPTLVTSVAYDELWRGRIPPYAELDDVSPDWRARWDPAHSPRRPRKSLRAAIREVGDRELAAKLELVRELAAAGAPLLAGTDTPNPYVVPGASLHQELALFTAAGLSPYAALRAATIDAEDFLGEPKAGRIAVGTRADLVLLDDNPLADLHALDHIEGVALRGKWLAADDLRARHDELVAKYRDPVWLHPIDLPGGIQYVVSDNSAAVGAYALVREGRALIERQTLEDETIGVQATEQGLAVDVDRATGVLHAEHRRGAVRLVGWLTPATALALVAPLKIDPEQRIAFRVDQPDRDAPEQLLHGDLSIRRTDDGTGDARTYRIRLTVEHGTWTARLVLDRDGLPRVLEVSDAARPVVRTWRRQRTRS